MGPTGAGKSSLANVFIGEIPDCTDCVFPICPGNVIVGIVKPSIIQKHKYFDTIKI